MLKVTFHGAAQTTTGSMHLIEASGRRILLDCGLFQGHRKEAFERNRRLPLDAASLDAVLLSHAHIDHSGNLPTLARRGFRGRVICTPATADLCEVMLRDSAFLQAQDLEHVNKRRRSQGRTPFEPLYEPKDVEAILNRFEPEPLSRGIDLGAGVTAVFHEAGHILGSAIIQLDVRTGPGKPHRLVFTGDLGQTRQPIIRDPAPVVGAHTLLIESTYADRLHPSEEDVRGRLKAFIEDIHQQKARMLIPAFSVGRTQQLLYHLNTLVESGRIPPTPVYVDSPLASRATAIYASHHECYDAETSEAMRSGDNPLRFRGLRFTGSVEESMALNDLPGPLVIISASGMCEGGRILHHLKHGIPDPRNIVLIVGFQAENTLGRRLVERQPVVRIFGDEYPLNARVHTINALSAHADRDGLLRWFDATRSPSLQRVFAIHGEPEKVTAMAELLRTHGAPSATAPAPGQEAILAE